jgi:chromosome segregation ATPase
MNQTNFGRSLIEQMAMSDIEERFKKINERIGFRETQIKEAKDHIKQLNKEKRKMSKDYDKHLKKKIEYEQDSL